MAQQLHWLETHLRSLEKATEYANRYFWNLSVVEGGNENNRKWFVHSGEDVIFSADSRDAVDAFLYGMGLAYHVLPDECLMLVKRMTGLDEDDQ